MILYLNSDLELEANALTFNYLMNYQGEVYRHQKNRITQKIEIKGKNYFIKQHHGVGWREVFKNLFSFKLPVTSALQEWLAIKACFKSGIAVPKVAAFGQKGKNPAKLKSFILLQALSPIISLEELTHSWKNQPPKAHFKYMLIKKVASIARTLHQHKISHRDFYLCHFLLAEPYTRDAPLYLIDLHRATQHLYIRKRWIIKDLAGLYFSSQNIGLTKRDCLRFIKTYTQQSLKHVLTKKLIFWLKVKKRGEQLYDEHRK